MIPFKNRIDAGKQLAQALRHYAHKPNTVVLGLARGGVVVAHKVATILHLPLNIMVVRKIGAPGFPELAVGALTQNGIPLLDEKLMQSIGITQESLMPIIASERIELARRLKKYCTGKQPLDCKNKTVILVDDGIATGATMKAAIKSAYDLGAKKVVVAVPLCPPEEVEGIKKLVDEFVCIEKSIYFPAIGSFYKEFAQVEDDEVIALLKE